MRINGREVSIQLMYFNLSLHLEYCFALYLCNSNSQFHPFIRDPEDSSKGPYIFDILAIQISFLTQAKRVFKCLEEHLEIMRCLLFFQN